MPFPDQFSTAASDAEGRRVVTTGGTSSGSSTLAAAEAGHAGHREGGRGHSMMVQRQFEPADADGV